MGVGEAGKVPSQLGAEAVPVRKAGPEAEDFRIERTGKELRPQVLVFGCKPDSGLLPVGKVPG